MGQPIGVREIAMEAPVSHDACSWSGKVLRGIVFEIVEIDGSKTGWVQPPPDKLFAESRFGFRTDGSKDHLLPTGFKRFPSPYEAISGTISQELPRKQDQAQVRGFFRVWA
jgi:hypothetical protein